MFTAADPWRAALIYELHAIPVIAVTVMTRLRRHARGREELAVILAVAAMAVAINYSFLRDPLEQRLPHAIVPAVVLGVLLCHRATQAARATRETALAAACALASSVSVVRVGRPG